jgi:hypothetical protein
MCAILKKQIEQVALARASRELERAKRIGYRREACRKVFWKTFAAAVEELKAVHRENE